MPRRDITPDSEAAYNRDPPSPGEMPCNSSAQNSYNFLLHEIVTKMSQNSGNVGSSASNAMYPAFCSQGVEGGRLKATLEPPAISRPAVSRSIRSARRAERTDARQPRHRAAGRHAARTASLKLRCTLTHGVAASATWASAVLQRVTFARRTIGAALQRRSASPWPRRRAYHRKGWTRRF